MTRAAWAPVRAVVAVVGVAVAGAAAVVALGSAGCAGQPEVKDSRSAFAAPVVATTSAAEPHNVACSPKDAEVERKYRTVTPKELEGEVVSKVYPRLGENDTGHGRYLVAVDVDGHVAEVRIFEAVRGNLAVASALCQWKFKPQPQPIRAVWFMGFGVGSRFR